jgi:hypothetical protein
VLADFYKQILISEICIINLQVLILITCIQHKLGGLSLASFRKQHGDVRLNRSALWGNQEEDEILAASS